MSSDGMDLDFCGTSGVCLRARDCIGNSWDILSALLFLVEMSLLSPGGAIPTRRYTFSTDVGLRHPVME